MGKKRKAVPAALHSEVSEYVSLLRVLRTTSTLDVASHLTRLPSPAPAIIGEVPVVEEDPEQTQAATPTHEASPTTSSHVKSTRQASHAGKPRDTWTRWPLLTSDVPIPEWTFEDEIHSLAKQALTSQHDHSSQSPSRSSSPDVDESEELLPDASVRVLADVSAAHLEQILASLAGYVPISKKSSQNRHDPVGWQEVLSIVSAAGLVNEQAVTDVQHRLELIYGRENRARTTVERAALRAADRQKVSAKVSPRALDFLESYGGGVSQKRKRGKYKSRRGADADDAEVQDT
ncbi:hypothetical protein BV25DRAFT_1830205 [Artomyces pyxidatus]|uniref:Uncharacterized protein n=1 Tax=Artomyces pyxidatus TaxID=48021 RepID=A0ACB8SQ72_9AGAM|nr:hypothetical protein BV25DRAFT_1830205 [Artomyces pyxidatus]